MASKYNIEMGNKGHKEIPGNPSTATSSTKKLNDRSNGKPLRVLSEEDWAFWKHNGYIVIKNAVPKEQAQATANFLWEFDEKDPNDPETWYAPPRAEMKMKELTGTGMVEVYNHQHLWNNRQTQRVYDAFVDVWGTEELWVTIDRANLNFPQRPALNERVLSIGITIRKQNPRMCKECWLWQIRPMRTWEAFSAYPGSIGITRPGKWDSQKIEIGSNQTYPIWKIRS